jgi:hypothetical protein
MNTTTTLIQRDDYEVVAEAYVTDESLDVLNITYLCNKSSQAIDITDFLYDFLDISSIKQKLTIKYVKDKMIRMPLDFNQTWNEDIKNCKTVNQIIDYIDLFGTTDEHWRLVKAVIEWEKSNDIKN